MNIRARPLASISSVEHSGTEIITKPDPVPGSFEPAIEIHAGTLDIEVPFAVFGCVRTDDGSAHLNSIDGKKVLFVADSAYITVELSMSYSMPGPANQLKRSSAFSFSASA